MNIKKGWFRTGIWVISVQLLLSVFVLPMKNVEAAEIKVEFMAGGTLIIKDSSAYESTGGNPSHGIIDENTSIVSMGNLEVVVESNEAIKVSDISVTGGNLAIKGAGSLTARNSNNDAIHATGNINISSKVLGESLLRGVYAEGQLTVSAGGDVIGKALTNTPIGSSGGVFAKGNIICNNGKIYGSGRYTSIYSEAGDITVNNGGAIQSDFAGTYPIRAQKGDVVADGGTIICNAALVDGVTTGIHSGAIVTPYTVEAKNGGKIFGRGDNAGVGGEALVCDNATIEGDSKRIGVSGNNTLIARNTGKIIGTITDQGSSQSYGVICWDGNVIANSNGSITGTGELGVVSYSDSIEANGGSIIGNALVYSVYAAKAITAVNASINGISSGEEAYVRAIYAKTTISANNSTLEGKAKYYGVVAINSILADNKSTVKGIADIRIDNGAAVQSSSITAKGSSTIFEYYYGESVEIGSEIPVNPYFSSKNMTDLNHFTWSADPGAVAIKDNGLIATRSSDKSTVQALRNYEAGVDEVVSLSGNGDRHIIQLPAKLVANEIVTSAPTEADTSVPTANITPAPDIDITPTPPMIPAVSPTKQPGTINFLTGQPGNTMLYIIGIAALLALAVVVFIRRKKRK